MSIFKLYEEWRFIEGLVILCNNRGRLSIYGDRLQSAQANFARIDFRKGKSHGGS